jgi:DNA helicase HerA-like ATPase
MSNETLTKVVAAARAAFPGSAHPGSFVSLGAVVHEGAVHPEPLVGIPLSMMNRHGLIAGATGTGKTKTLQRLAESLAAAGVPVFVSDVKGDLSGLAAAGTTNARIEERVRQTGFSWQPASFPVELFSLSGALGAQLRATVSSFGPLALAKVLGLNETQTSVLSLVFKYCDDKRLPLLDFKDLRTVLQHLTGDGAAELKDYGGISKASVGVLLREMVALEQQGAGIFFGEPELELDDLLEVLPDGRGRVSILELSDVQDKPALFSTFMMWMLAELYHALPEVGDLEKPKLVFFFDEAHLLFRDASKAFLSQVEQVVRLVRSKGVGVFFVTQNPKDVPPEILGQLGNRVQHALRAFTPDDEKALRSAARTFPRTPFYEVETTLTSLGIGEALVTVLSDNGAPTPPFVTRVAPPVSRMGPLTKDELGPLLATDQVRFYATPIDRESAHELLSRRFEPAPSARNVQRETGSIDDGVHTDEYGQPPRPRSSSRPSSRSSPSSSDEDSGWGEILGSPVARTIASEVTRGLMGALLGRKPRRRSTRSWF